MKSGLREMKDPVAMKLLIVEDDQDSRELLAEFLSSEFEVHTASDGPTGLTVFQEKSPDVVITDESLPGLRGVSLAQKIKALRPSAGVILISGFTQVPG